VEVNTADGDTVVYEYDDENIRVSSTVNGTKTTYLVDSNRPYAQVLEEYEDENLKVRYVHGLDLISVERDGEVSVYLVDGLESTRVLTDLDGEVVATYTYDAFGALLDSTGEVENDYLFAGEPFDGELEQYYLRQRFYDAETGRFTRRDSYEGRIGEPITLHKYLYGNANPVNFVDPSGLFTIQEQFFVLDQLSLAATTGYILTFASNSIISSINKFTPRQEAILANYPGYVRLLLEKDDDSDCWTADIRRSEGGSSDNFIPNSAAYANQVTRSSFDFLVLGKMEAKAFDGKTPNTRDIWEAKCGYELYTRNDLPFIERRIVVWDLDKDKGLRLAGECQFNLAWALSNHTLANRIRQRWNNVPPVYHIPFI